MKKLVIDMGRAVLTTELGVDSPPIDVDGSATAMSVSELRTNLCGMTELELEQLHEQVLKYVCEKRMPLPEQKYYEFIEVGLDSVLFLSKGVSWEGGQEVRLARSVDYKRILLLRSRLGMPIYIVTTQDELELWMKVWKGRAFLTLEMAGSFIPDVL